MPPIGQQARQAFRADSMNAADSMMRSGQRGRVLADHANLLSPRLRRRRRWEELLDESLQRLGIRGRSSGRTGSQPVKQGGARSWTACEEVAEARGIKSEAGT